MRGARRPQGRPDGAPRSPCDGGEILRHRHRQLDRYVGFVPNTKNPLASLNDFVGRGQQRNGEAEGFDDQLETRRLFDRQIAGLRTFQDIVDVADRAAQIIGEIRSIRQQQAVRDLFSGR